MLQLLLVLHVAVGRGDGGHGGPEPQPSSHTHPPASLTLTHAGACARALAHIPPVTHRPVHTHTETHVRACITITQAHSHPSSVHTCAQTHTSLRGSTHTLVGTSAHVHPHTQTWVFPCLSWAQMDPCSRTHTEAHSQLGVLLSYTGPLLFVLRNGGHAGTLASTEDLGSPEPLPPQHRGNPVVVQICVFPNTQSLSGLTHTAAHSLPSFTHARAHTHHPQSHGPSLHSGSTPYSPPHPSAEQARGTEAVSQGPLEPPQLQEGPGKGERGTGRLEKKG